MDRTEPRPRAEHRARRNRDADWNAWPVVDYLAENYRRLHPCDVGVIHHHSAVYRSYAPGALDRTLELGAGPNLYPLMLAGAATSNPAPPTSATSATSSSTGQTTAGGPSTRSAARSTPPSRRAAPTRSPGYGSCPARRTT
ncbi:hypothetical protein [Streptomyces sp. SS]|uniref:hypothetical protein n=1 Tax=Streptomyces sp. SS TaxID=260742 RepID=UPI0002FB04DC